MKEKCRGSRSGETRKARLVFLPVCVLTFCWIFNTYLVLSITRAPCTIHYYRLAFSIPHVESNSRSTNSADVHSGVVSTAVWADSSIGGGEKNKTNLIVLAHAQSEHTTQMMCTLLWVCKRPIWLVWFVVWLLTVNMTDTHSLIVYQAWREVIVSSKIN